MSNYKGGELSNVNELVDKLIGLQPTIITIDGLAGVGKTTLGSQIADQLSASHIDLDNYLIKDQGQFVAAIRLNELEQAIKQYSQPLIVSGVCVLSVMQKANYIPSCKVYIKRMADWGWVDQDEIESELLENVAQALNVPIADYVLPLEVRSYHRQYQPHKSADFTFLRLQNSNQ